MAVAAEIEKLRQSEYKRLLLLQGDGLVTPEEAEEAGQLLEKARDEVTTRRTALRELEARLKTLKAKSS